MLLAGIARRPRAVALAFISLLALILSIARSASVAVSPSPRPSLRQASVASGTDWAAVRELRGQRSLSFEANRGQADPQVQYLARGADYTLYLSPGAALVLAARSPEAAAEPASVRMRLLGADASAPGAPGDELPGRSSYLLGDDPAR